MVAWLMSWNPRKYHLESELEAGGVLDSWVVGRFKTEMAAGDHFALWRVGRNAGVVATGTLTGIVAEPTESGEAPYWAEDPGPRLHVPLKIDHWFLSNAVPKAWFQVQAIFAGATILSQPFATNPHRLTDAQWHALEAVIPIDNEGLGGVDFQPGVATDDWHLNPGDKIRRVELHERYGGSHQGGITPSSLTPNVLCFTDRVTGLRNGYEDTWETNDIFRCTGEGPRGPQRFTRGNKAIRDHAKNGYHLRLFLGSRGVVRYAGEFVLDPEEPYSLGQAPAAGGGPDRQVIRFLMHRVGAAALHTDLPVGIQYRRVDEESAPSPAKASAPDPDLMGRNLRAHRRLQNDLALAVRDRGMKPLSPTALDPAFDLAWRATVDSITVCEVKSLTTANETQATPHWSGPGTRLHGPARCPRTCGARGVVDRATAN
jgi:hypothetical protein